MHKLAIGPNENRRFPVEHLIASYLELPHYLVKLCSKSQHGSETQVSCDFGSEKKRQLGRKRERNMVLHPSYLIVAAIVCSSHGRFFQDTGITMFSNGVMSKLVSVRVSF